MDWGNLDLGDSYDEEEANWKMRFDYLINEVDDFNYIITKCHPKKVGNLYVSRCPFPNHNERTGSFTIYPPGTLVNGEPQTNTSFYCFGCGVGGDVITFYQHYHSFNEKREACVAFEKELGIDVKQTDIRNKMLLDGLKEMNNFSYQGMDSNMINYICSKICRDYLNFVKNNHKEKIKNEFYLIQDFFKGFDEKMADMTVEESMKLIDITTDFINKRKTRLK